MEYLYQLQLLRPEMLKIGPTPFELEVMTQHLQYLKDLADKGALILAGRTQVNDARAMGLAIFRAQSDEEAQRIMENDPAVSNGVMRAELFPYKVAVAGSFSE